MQSQENVKHLGRSQNDSGIIQRKLQRAYQEKELLLGEVQSLRQQLRSMKEQQKSKTVEVGVPTENIDGWNHLLEANMKSGTLACVWCIKSHYIKMIACAFGKWKCFSACAYTLSNGGPSISIEADAVASGGVVHRADNLRMKRLLTSAQKVMTSKGGEGPSVPNFMKHRTRSANSSPVAAHPYQGSSAFENSLRRRSLSPGKRSDARESRTSPPKKMPMPSYSTPTYSSLKMFNQGSPTNSFRHPNRSVAYMAYLKSKGNDGIPASMANTSPPSLRPTENHNSAAQVASIAHLTTARHDIVQAARGATTSGHTDFADDVSEISSDNDEILGRRGSPGGKIKNPAEPVLFAKSIDHSRNERPAQHTTPSYAMQTRPGLGLGAGGSGVRGPPKGSSNNKMAGMSASRRPASAGATASHKPKMDKAQMRLLYGSVDDAPSVGQGWSNNLRADGAATSRQSMQAPPGVARRTANRRSSFKFKL